MMDYVLAGRRWICPIPSATWNYKKGHSWRTDTYLRRKKETTLTGGCSSSGARKGTYIETLVGGIGSTYAF